MNPGAYNFTIYKGITFARSFVWKDSASVAVPITGWTAYLDARRSPSKAVAFSLTCTIPTGTDGKTVVAYTAAQTDALTAGDYKYDLVFLNDSGERVGPLVAGTITVEELNTQL